MAEHLLERVTDPEERSRIERLIDEERNKEDSAYPPSRSGSKPLA